MHASRIGISPVKSILHVTPYYYSTASVIGGGERYCNHIIKSAYAATAANRPLSQALLSFGSETAITDRFIAIAGRPEAIRSIDIANLRRAIAKFDVIHVHQCLTGIGLLVATIARELRKITIGTDHGGGEHHFLHDFPHMANVYDGFHAQSEFATSAFASFRIPTVCIRGPVDDTVPLRPITVGSQFAGNGIAVVGRFLPHKGYETLIDVIDTTGRPVVIAGQNYDPDYTQMLRSRAAGKPVSFRFDLSDDDVVDLLANSQVYVHTSHHVDFRGHRHFKPELLGLAPLDALCQGTRAIVSTAGSLGELSNVLGCVAYRTPGELKQLIQQVFSEPLVFSREEIRRDCVAKYGGHVFGRQYIQFIDGFCQ